MEEWGISRVLRHDTQPVVCIARAARRVRDWRKEGKGNGTKCAETGEYKKQPPVRLAQQLVHWRTRWMGMVTAGRTAAGEEIEDDSAGWCVVDAGRGTRARAA